MVHQWFLIIRIHLCITYIESQSSLSRQHFILKIPCKHSVPVHHASNTVPFLIQQTSASTWCAYDPLLDPHLWFLLGLLQRARPAFDSSRSRRLMSSYPKASSVHRGFCPTTLVHPIPHQLSRQIVCFTSLSVSSRALSSGNHLRLGKQVRYGISIIQHRVYL